MKVPTEDQFRKFFQKNFNTYDWVEGLHSVWVESTDWDDVNPEHREVIAFIRKCVEGKGVHQQ